MATGKGTHQPMEVEKSSRASSIVTTASGASGTSAVNSEVYTQEHAVLHVYRLDRDGAEAV